MLSKPASELEIRTARLDAGAARALMCEAERPNLLQSPVYAQALCALKGQRPLWAVMEDGGQTAGYAMIREAALFGRALHGLILDRGPVWFPGHGRPDQLRSFFAWLQRECPRRPGRRRRIMPELEDTPANRRMMADLGYRPSARIPAYRTIWVDLRADRDALRRNLAQKWRNVLNRAEKLSSLAVEWTQDGPGELKWLLARHGAHRRRLGYGGADLRILLALSAAHIKTGDLRLGRVLLDGEAVAGILLLVHGNAATYQIGWTGEEGRARGAQNLLLWQAAVKLKEEGLSWLDLGGINDTEAHGLTRFKQGMGGREASFAGAYV